MQAGLKHLTESSVPLYEQAREVTGVTTAYPLAEQGRP